MKAMEEEWKTWIAAWREDADALAADAGSEIQRTLLLGDKAAGKRLLLCCQLDECIASALNWGNRTRAQKLLLLRTQIRRELRQDTRQGLAEQLQLLR
jgi:hypothetical protein